MKVILFNGSPNKNGCTYTALTEIEKELNNEGIDTLIFHAGAATKGCLGCCYCRKNGKCITDDCVNEAIKLLEEADGFVFASPVHYAAMSGMMTSFLDRLFYAGGRKVKGKPAATIVSCRRGGASAAFEIINKYFMMTNMPVVTSQYWNQVHGNTPDEVKQDLEGLQTVRVLAQNMTWLLRCIEAGKAAGVEYPEYEPKQRTNFIR